jgi:cell division protein FtsI/penicillin-binding protein 2
VVNLAAHHVLGLAATTNLQRRGTAYIKRLQQMRRVRRHAESNNLILFAVLLKFERVVALMVVEHKQLVRANSAPLCMRVKVRQGGAEILARQGRVYAEQSAPPLS